MNKRLLTNGAFVGALLLVVLVIVGHFVIDGFTSGFSLRAMLVLAAFLGIATVGQTLVALVGGLDLSIPFLIGSANIFTLWLMSQGWPDLLAIGAVLLLGAVIGLINGLLSLRLQGQALIISLAVGFATVGLTQIRTTVGSDFGGNVNAPVPDWLLKFSSPQGSSFGLGFPPVVVLWALLALVTLVLIRRTTAGRALYTVGGNRNAAKYVLVSESRTWCGAYAISGFTAALTGVALLGFTGGGFVGVGDPYLFTSVAAVVVGGTSLLGGRGGYGHTVIGVLVLTVLGTLLVGIGLSTAGQQVVLGLLIIPMVALYARSPHPRMTV
jgi:ribose transport system permease protein